MGKPEQRVDSIVIPLTARCDQRFGNPPLIFSSLLEMCIS